MFDFNEFASSFAENWHVWVVTITLVVAAVIDGIQLKVPNWITFPMIVSGWIYSTALSPYAGWEGLWFSLGGTLVGLALLMPAYAIGGMGAGDVKLLAGVGAWMWATNTFYAFAATALVGPMEAFLEQTQKPVLVHPQRNRHGKRSGKAFRNRCRTKANHVFAALWNSNCDRFDCLLRLPRHAALKNQVKHFSQLQ